MNPTRVLVADPLRIFRTGVRNLLLRAGDFEVAEAASLEEALVRADAFAPDLVLIDLDLPPHGGVAAVRELARHSRAVPILWSFGGAGDTVLAGLRAGAAGYLHKETSPDGLLRALRGAARGEAALSRDLVSDLVEALHRVDEHAQALERASVLTSREREVLELVARGARSADIAATLGISAFTVKRHVQNILQKLDVPTRRAAAALYRSAFGVGEAPVPAPARA